jgi:hypothetical protein
MGIFASDVFKYPSVQVRCYHNFHDERILFLGRSKHGNDTLLLVLVIQLLYFRSQPLRVGHPRDRISNLLESRWKCNDFLNRFPRRSMFRISNPSISSPGDFNHFRRKYFITAGSALQIVVGIARSVTGAPYGCSAMMNLQFNLAP